MAVAPGDYTARLGTGGLGIPLTFAPGVTSMPFAVAVKGNIGVEPDEDFFADIVSVNSTGSSAMARGSPPY